MNSQSSPDPETWLSGLRGDAPTPEASLLRNLIQSNPTQVPELDAQRREHFIRNLRKQGAFSTPSVVQNWVAGNLQALLSIFYGHGLAMVASIAVLGIGLSVTMKATSKMATPLPHAPRRALQ